MYKAVRMFNYKDGLGLEQEALKGVCEVEEHVCSTEDDVIKYCQDADAVMGIFEPLTARVINSLPKLKLIACKSMGYNYVDLEAAKARGISVTHLRSAFSIDVADYVTACILAHNKRLFAYDRSVRRDKKWDYSVCPDIHRFNAETVGLAGFGQIARLVAKNLSGFGVRILAAHQPRLAPEAAEHGVDLQVSGHTHGGMIAGIDRLVARFNEGFVSGLYTVGGMKLYVSNGAGIWNGFPIRIGVPSEIVLIRLRKEE